MATETKAQEKDWVEEVGAPAYASIADMVAALNCDYDRLEELRDERDGFTFDADVNSAPDGPGYANDVEAWKSENPDEAEELRELEEAAGECGSREEAEQRIQEDPLSLEFRSGWETNTGDFSAAEYNLLLGTGGPAVRIVGDIDNGEAKTAHLEVQDWFKPWTEYVPADQDVLLAYVRCFCFES